MNNKKIYRHPYHEPSGLKQRIFILSIGQKSRHGFVKCSAQGLGQKSGLFSEFYC